MADADETQGDQEEPTAQPTALRRQQFFVAGGGATVAALAVTISIVQRFPESTAVAVLAGFAAGAVVYRLAVSSIFPGESAEN